MRDAGVCLLGPAEVRLGNEDVSHGEHAQPAQLLRRVEHHRGEPAHNHTHTSQLDQWIRIRNRNKDQGGQK